MMDSQYYYVILYSSRSKMLMKSLKKYCA